MAIANFFDKVARGAAQILKGFDRDSLISALTVQRIGVAFDSKALGSREARTSLEMSVNLLSRFYPRLIFVADQKDLDSAGWLVGDLPRSINPDIDIEFNTPELSACLAFGDSRPDAAGPVISVGSDRWIARLSSSRPTSSGDSMNPFGAGAAACLGVANLFRSTFGTHLPNAGLDADLTLSVLDFAQNGTAQPGPEIDAVDLGESYLIGLGAIGNGAIWALARISGLHGTLHIVDDETIDLTNLQRYVLTRQGSVGSSKVGLASESLSETGLSIESHAVRWGEYLIHREDWRFERVAVAVDSALDRQEIQGCLPRWIANAWTQPGNIGISRHSFVGDDACLMCLYLPTSKSKNEDELIASAIGLPEAILEVRDLLFKGTPLTADWIERIAAANKLPSTELQQYMGKPLRAFYSEAICGGLVMQLGGGAGPAQAEVPMAFQSALAGILLAAELVANAGGLKTSPPPVISRIDLLRPLIARVSENRKKVMDGRCICQDQDFVNAYM